MLYRRVPKNGDEISALGYGCMRLPMKTFSIDEARAIRQIRSAIDAGVNYVDTAWPYHGGKSEVVLGKALADGYRERVKVADKLPHWACADARDMEAKLDEQLRRLGLSCIDYYLIHNLDGASWARCKEKGVVAFLEKARADGKIVNAGFSFHGAAADFPAIVDDHDWVFCQIQYNILDERNQAGRAGLEHAASRDVAVMVMEPLRGGALVGVLPDAVRAIYDAAPTTRSPVDWALSWVFDQPGVTCVLSGMNDEAHIAENLAITERSPVGCLSEEERAIVARAAETYRTLQRVPCTACQYCMPCPAGVNIPMAFSLYNARHLLRDRHSHFQYLVFLGGALGRKAGLASQCTNCGACVKKCPQKIDVPTELAAVRGDFEGFFSRIFLRLVRLFAG